MTPSNIIVVIVIIIRFLSSGANQKRSANALARDLLHTVVRQSLSHFGRGAALN